MRYTYDSEVDMHYVYLEESVPSKVSRSIETQAVVDLDEYGNIVGIEVFGIAKALPEEIGL